MRFHATVLLKGKTACGISVPEEIVTSMGSKRPAVRVTINRHTYRSTVAHMGGQYLVGVSAENRDAAGVKAGDSVDVDIELDTEPRVIDVPPDLAAALESDHEASTFFTSLSYSGKARLVLPIQGAKTAETRQRRLSKTISMLRDGGRPKN